MKTLYPWSKEEDDFLMNLAERFPVTMVVSKINTWHCINKRSITRTLGSVRWRLYKLGFSVRPVVDNMNGSEWAKQLNLCRATITVWVKKHGLECIKLRTGRLVIGVKEMTDFAKRRPDLLSIVDQEILEYFFEADLVKLINDHKADREKISKKKEVRRIDTGKIYPSIRQASKELGVRRRSVQEEVARPDGWLQLV